MKRYSFRSNIIVSFMTLVFLLISISVTPANAADEVLTMKLDPGFNGYARMGQAFPLKAVIENKGPEIKGSLEVSVVRNDTRVIYKKKVLLPTGCKKQVEMYIPGYQGELYNIKLMDGEVKLLEERLRITNIRPQELVVGVLAADTSTVNYLAAIKMPSEGQRVNVINLDIDDIPANSLLLENIDVLVLNDYSTSALSDEQIGSIHSWVEQGGLLVAAGGVNWQKTLGPLAEQFLPVSVTGTQSITNIPGMEKFSGEALVNTNKFVISKGTLTCGETLVSIGDTPIIAQRQMGKGNVIYTGYDLAMEPFKSWSGNEKLWWSILSGSDPHSIMSAGNAREEMMYRSARFDRFVSNIPATDLPTGGKLAIFLIIYVFIMGPAIYLILKKFDRRDLGWVVIPVVAILLFSCTYMFGFKTKGRDVFQNVVSLVTIEPDLQYSRVSSYIGVFAPTRTEYALNLPGEKIVEVQPVDGPGRMYRSTYRFAPGSIDEKMPILATISEGQDSQVKFADSSRWSMRTIHSEENIPKSGDISGELHTINGRIEGQVTNNTGSDLSDCLVLSNYGYQKINRLAAGESVPIAFEPRVKGNNRGPVIYQVSSRYPVHKPREIRYEPWRQEEMSRQMLELVASRVDLANNPVVFVGKSQDRAKDIVENDNEGKTYSSTFYIAPINISLDQDNKISIPPGITSKRVVSIDAQHFHQDMYGYNIDNGSAVFEADLPYKPGEIEIDKLVLFVQGDQRMGRMIKQELFNYKSGEWETVNWMPTGLNLDETKYVSPEGSIRIRLGSGKDSHVYFSDITVSMEGHNLSSNKNGGGE